MKTSLHSFLSTRRLNVVPGARCILTLLLLLRVTSSGRAENPWTAPLPAWSSSGSHWSSWETTRGGTFGDPFLAPRSTHHYAPAPAAIRNPDIDPAMIKAGSIAEHRALPHSSDFCWRYVKEALVAAGSVNSYPETVFAKEAGSDLVEHHGFVKLPVHCAERAPVGSVIVYGGRGAGHVELRTTRGFVSDYYCARPSGLPFIGAYTRLERHHKEIRTAGLVATVGSGS